MASLPDSIKIFPYLRKFYVHNNCFILPLSVKLDPYDNLGFPVCHEYFLLNSKLNALKINHYTSPLQRSSVRAEQFHVLLWVFILTAKPYNKSLSCEKEALNKIQSLTRKSLFGQDSWILAKFFVTFLWASANTRPSVL